MTDCPTHMKWLQQLNPGAALHTQLHYPGWKYSRKHKCLFHSVWLSFDIPAGLLGKQLLDSYIFRDIHWMSLAHLCYHSLQHSPEEQSKPNSISVSNSLQNNY